MRDWPWIVSHRCRVLRHLPALRQGVDKKKKKKTDGEAVENYQSMCEEVHQYGIGAQVLGSYPQKICWQCIVKSISAGLLLLLRLLVCFDRIFSCQRFIELVSRKKKILRKNKRKVATFLARWCYQKLSGLFGLTLASMNNASWRARERNYKLRVKMACSMRKTWLA